MCLTIGFVFTLVYYSIILTNVKKVPYVVKYYFLVLQDTHMEAAAAFTRLDGGAGYTLNVEGRYYVAISVYFNEATAIAVQQRLTQEGKNTKIIPQGCNALYFKTYKQKKQEERYIKELGFFSIYTQIVSACIKNLETGGTQESCKKQLRLLQRNMTYFSNSNVVYSQLAKSVEHIAQKVSLFQDGIIFAKDLRYLLCEMATEHIFLVNKFCL